MIDLSSLKKILSSLEFYPKTQEMRHLILINDPDAVKQLPKALAQILKDQKSEPLQILQAIRVPNLDFLVQQGLHRDLQ